jgi:geranylgeranyl pyrophosphate synthase
MNAETTARSQEPENAAPPSLAALLDRSFDPEILAALLDPVVDGPAEDLAKEALLSPASLAPGVPRAVWEEALLAPVRDILNRPAKGFRAALVNACYRLAGGSEPPPAGLAALVEVVHAGSLVIDDIQDDSSRRRGRAALHRLHGVPLAINCGNWMYFWPFQLLGELGLPAAREAAMRARLAAGMFRCHFGQALDLSVHVGRMRPDRVPSIVRATALLKTGSLTELAATLGAEAGGASPEKLAALARFGRRLGVGLQVLDDLGNLAAAPAGASPNAEKRPEDLRRGRPTWPWAFAAEQLDEPRFAALQAEVRVLSARSAAGAPSAQQVETLAAALRTAVGMRGRRAARVYLERALGDLERAFAGAPEIAELRQMVTVLEAAYGPA